jgi:hypothetical protein
MDVYMPRDKVNRAEHRGFGFVTFETEAAVARANAHGQHQIRRARADCRGPRAMLRTKRRVLRLVRGVAPGGRRGV